MRVISILILASLFGSCLNRPQTDLAKIFPDEKLQIYSIDPDKDTTIAGTKGIVIQIDSSSFLTRDGQRPDGRVEIGLREYTSLKDFIGGDLSTVTIDGKVLRSSGVIYIEATSQGEPLVVDKNAAITLKFPRLEKAAVVNLFSGSNSPGGQVEWTLLEPVYNDTTVFSKYIFSWFNGGWGEHIEIKSFVVIGLDTISVDSISDYRPFKKHSKRFRARNDCLEYLEPSTIDSTIDLRPVSYYTFQTKNLGFINCDIFVDESLEVITVIPEYDDSDVFVIIEGMNSVLYPVYPSQPDRLEFRIPRGMPVRIVAYKKEGDDNYLGLKKGTSSTNQYFIKQVRMTLKQVQSRIENLENSADTDKPPVVLF